MELQGAWHGLRQDLEELIQTQATKAGITLPSTMKNRPAGSYLPNTFLGHCSQAGADGYHAMEMNLDILAQIPALIWGDTPVNHSPPPPAAAGSK